MALTCPRSLHIPLASHISASFGATEDDMQVEDAEEDVEEDDGGEMEEVGGAAVGAGRRCRECGAGGHNRRTCPQAKGGGKGGGKGGDTGGKGGSSSSRSSSSRSSSSKGVTGGKGGGSREEAVGEVEEAVREVAREVVVFPSGRMLTVGGRVRVDGDDYFFLRKSKAWCWIAPVGGGAARTTRLNSITVVEAVEEEEDEEDEDAGSIIVNRLCMCMCVMIQLLNPCDTT